MAFKGTIMTYGRARAVTVATGMQTEIGRIAALLEEDGNAHTPLQKRLAQFGKRLALAILAICALMFAVGLLRGEEPLLMFLTAVSLAVAASVRRTQNGARERIDKAPASSRDARLGDMDLF
jgi:Ca2+-transporting ATPase